MTFKEKTLKRLTLVLDAMSGDFGPIVTVPASIQALVLYEHLEILLVGNPIMIEPLLFKVNQILLKRLIIIPAKFIIANDIKLSHIIRSSRGTSMRIALEILKEGRAQACISAGNTGALMGLSKIILKPLKGICRPALMVIMPNYNNDKTVLLDIGANIICNSDLLVQFAIMGSVVAEQIVGLNHPRIALLNIGEEEIKGLGNIQQASKILRNISSINYIGYLEANDLLTGKTDVLVCDGFIGNITLKTMEGIIKVILSSLIYSNTKFKQNWIIKYTKTWIKNILIKKFDKLNPDQYNGACLIGLKGIVIKSHGSANQYAIVAAIKQAILAVEQNISEKIAARLDSILPKSD